MKKPLLHSNTLMNITNQKTNDIFKLFMHILINTLDFVLTTNKLVMRDIFKKQRYSDLK